MTQETQDGVEVDEQVEDWSMERLVGILEANGIIVTDYMDGFVGFDGDDETGFRAVEIAWENGYSVHELARRWHRITGRKELRPPFWAMYFVIIRRPGK